MIYGEICDQIVEAEAESNGDRIELASGTTSRVEKIQWWSNAKGSPVVHWTWKLKCSNVWNTVTPFVSLCFTWILSDMEIHW